jgi:hypothetical protein
MQMSMKRLYRSRRRTAPNCAALLAVSGALERLETKWFKKPASD